jgi:hypothetical protein
MIATRSCSGRSGSDCACVDEPAMKALGLHRRFERDRVLAGAGRTEIVGETPDRDHQRVVVEAARRRHLVAILVNERRDMHDAPRAVEADHLADPIAEVVPV